MHVDAGTITLLLVAFFAAIVNGALGYGFSSLAIPIALLFYTNKTLAPAFVAIEMVINFYVVIMNRHGLRAVAKRVMPIVLGLIPGIIIGSTMLSSGHPDWLKFFTYVVILPLILLQAGGFRRPIRAERKVAVPLGVGVGILYSTTTISGPPLAIMLNNQGLAKEEFRAAVGLVRVAETTMTAIAYSFLGLFARESAGVLSYLVPGIVLGLPIGAFIIRRINTETFRRICMSFDAWIVGFGLSRVAIELRLLPNPLAYSIMLVVALIDAYLLYYYFFVRKKGVYSASVQSDTAV